MDKIFFAIGCGLGFLGVALGAFGAHALREHFTPERLNIFEVGVRYQMYHALALMAVAWANIQYPNHLIPVAGWLFLAGVCIFSGSLYLLVLSGVRAWGAVTPIGGLLLLAGWFCLVTGVLRA